MTKSYISKVCLAVLLACLLGACASQPKPVTTSLQQEPAVIEAQPTIAEPVPEPVTEPVMQPEIQPAPAMPAEQKRSPFARKDVIWIQQRLQDLGYYNGAVDGAAGQATRDAIEAYQQDQGVTPDGKPTAELREFMWRNGG